MEESIGFHPKANIKLNTMVNNNIIGTIGNIMNLSRPEGEMDNITLKGIATRGYVWVMAVVSVHTKSIT